MAFGKDQEVKVLLLSCYLYLPPSHPGTSSSEKEPERSCWSGCSAVFSFLWPWEKTRKPWRSMPLFSRLSSGKSQKTSRERARRRLGKEPESRGIGPVTSLFTQARCHRTLRTTYHVEADTEPLGMSLGHRRASFQCHQPRFPPLHRKTPDGGVFSREASFDERRNEPQSSLEPDETACTQVLPLTMIPDKPMLAHRPKPESVSSVVPEDSLFAFRGRNQSSRNCHGAAQRRMSADYGQRSATLSQETTGNPTLLLLALRQHSLRRPGRSDRLKPTMQTMALPGRHRKVNVFTATTASQAIKFMSTPAAHNLAAVIAHDGAIVFRQNEQLASRVAGYVRTGGTMILGPRFSCTAVPSLANRFFAQVCHLPWMLQRARRSQVYFFNALVHSDPCDARRALLGRGTAGMIDATVLSDIDHETTLADPGVEKPPHVAFGESPPKLPSSLDTGDALGHVTKSRVHEPARLSSILLTSWPSLIDDISARPRRIYLAILRRGTYYMPFVDTCTRMWAVDPQDSEALAAALQLMIPSVRRHGPLVRYVPRPPSSLSHEKVALSPGSPAGFLPPLAGTVDNAAYGSFNRPFGGAIPATTSSSKRSRFMDFGDDDHATIGPICKRLREVAVSDGQSTQLLVSADEDAATPRPRPRPYTPRATVRPTVTEVREAPMSGVHCGQPLSPEDGDATPRPWSGSHTIQMPGTAFSFFEDAHEVDPVLIPGRYAPGDEVPLDLCMFPDAHMSTIPNPTLTGVDVDCSTVVSPRASVRVLKERSCNEANTGERGGGIAPRSRASANQALASTPTVFSRGSEHAPQESASPRLLPAGNSRKSEEPTSSWATAISGCLHTPLGGGEWATRVPRAQDSEDFELADYMSSDYTSTEFQSTVSDDTDSDSSWQAPPSFDQAVPSAIRWRTHVLKGVAPRDRVYCADSTGILAHRCAKDSPLEHDLPVSHAQELCRRDEGTAVAFAELGEGYIGFVGGLHGEYDDFEKPLRLSRRLDGPDLTEIDSKDASRKAKIERRLETAERTAHEVELIVAVMCNLLAARDAPEQPTGTWPTA